MTPTIDTAAMDIYQWLVHYQCNINLPNWLQHARIDSGRLAPKSGSRLRPGWDENKEAKGFLIMANGDTLVDRLHEDEIILDKEAPLWMDIENRVSFLIHLRGQQNNDGAYVVNTKKGKMAKIREFSNNNKYLRDNKVNFGKSVPVDFLSEDGGVPLREMGLKSRNAIRTAGAYGSVESYQLKATPYNSSGMGTVCKFTKDGLKSMFFIRLRRDPGVYADPESGERYEKYRLIGVYRNYRKSGEDVVLSSEHETNLMCFYSDRKGQIRKGSKGIVPVVEKNEMYRAYAPLEAIAK